MARKFISTRQRTPLRRLPNRCILCGRLISSNKIICDYCSRRALFRRLRR